MVAALPEWSERRTVESLGPRLLRRMGPALSQLGGSRAWHGWGCGLGSSITASV